MSNWDFITAEGISSLWPNSKWQKINIFCHFDFYHNRRNCISQITSPHMPKSNDHLMYHESLMSNDFLMSNPFTSNDHLMSTSVIQVRTEQGLVVKIRYSMKTTNLNFFCKSRQNLFSASQKTEFFYKSRKKIRTKFKFLSENWIRTFSRTSSIRIKL